jgi:hypothetical protein
MYNFVSRARREPAPNHRDTREPAFVEGTATFSRRDYPAGNLGGHRRLGIVLKPHVTYCKLDVISMKFWSQSH